MKFSSLQVIIENIRCANVSYYSMKMKRVRAKPGSDSPCSNEKSNFSSHKSA